MTVPTIVCPLCATEQPNAWDCAACGHPLHERPPLDVEVAVLEELETGRAGDAGNVATAIVPDFESTGLDPVPAPPAEFLEELETTAVSGPVSIEGEVMADIEPTSLPTEAPTAAAAGVTCRYCGTPWEEGSSIFCGRCGMRMPRVAAAPVAALALEGNAICPGCGTPSQTVGARCASCGQKVLAIG